MDIRETDNSLEISVVLKNTGKRDGAEAVQLYMQDAAASIVRPVKELKGFSKEYLKVGESREILFTLPKSQMGFYDEEAEYHLEDGRFILYVGGNSRDCLEQEINICF